MSMLRSGFAEFGTPLVQTTVWRKAGRTALPVVAVSTLLFPFLLLCGGCPPAKEAIGQGTRQTGELLSTVDPTGVIGAKNAAKDAYEAATKQINAIDTETLNQVLDRLSTATAMLNERLDALPVSHVSSASGDLAASAASLRRALEADRLQETIEAINKLVETLTAQAEALDLRRIGPLAEEASQAIAEFRGTIKELENTLEGPIADARSLLGKANAEIDSLPIEASRQALASVEEAVREATRQLETSAESFNETLASVRHTSRVATAALVIAGLCGLGGLVRLLRRRNA